MTAHSAPCIAIILVSVMVAGCAQDGTLATGNLNTSAINPPSGSQQAAKTNPLCLTLASQIEALNKDGIPQKVSKAALKKYRMKTADLAKADELNKANAEFQAKCSEYPPSATVAAAGAPAPVAAAKPKPVRVKAKPPLPAPKPVVAASAAPQATGSIVQKTEPTQTQP